jgi:hypothetical protein
VFKDFGQAIRPRPERRGKKVILYHFTAKHLAKKIRKEGLTKGAIPISFDPPKILWGYIWLTSNHSWHQDPISHKGSLPYSRTEVRLTVHIPDNGNLLKFDENKNITPLYEDMTRYGDPENWYIYKGIIPRGWIRKAESNPDNGEGVIE